MIVLYASKGLVLFCDSRSNRRLQSLIIMDYFSHLSYPSCCVFIIIPVLTVRQLHFTEDFSFLTLRQGQSEIPFYSLKGIRNSINRFDFCLFLLLCLTFQWLRSCVLLSLMSLYIHISLFDLSDHNFLRELNGYE
jgi:hypothetical protein